MPRNSSGVYTLPATNPVTPFTVITTAWANPTMSDIAAEITNSLDRDGRGGMRAPFRIFDGSLAQPGLGFLNEVGIGLYREAAGVAHLVNTGTRVITLRPSVAEFQGSARFLGATTHKKLGFKSWIVENQAGLFVLAPSDTVDGEDWNYTKATAWDPDTGAPTFPAAAGSYVRISGDTMSGKLAIQQTSASVLEQLALINLADSPDTGVQLGFYNAGAVSPAGFIVGRRVGAGTEFRLEFGTSTDLLAASTKMALDGDGNLGVGIIATSRLHVSGDVLVENGSLTLGSGGTYRAGAIFSDASWGMIFRALQPTPGNAQFMWADSAGVEIARLSPDGDLGLGALNPLSKLHIADGVYGNNQTCGITLSTDEAANGFLASIDLLSDGSSVPRLGLFGPTDGSFGELEALSLFGAATRYNQRLAQNSFSDLPAGGGAWDWSATTTAYGVTPGGNIAFAISNPASGEIKRLWVRGTHQVSFTVGGGAFSWITGFPTWGANGTLISLVCVDTNYVLGTTSPV